MKIYCRKNYIVSVVIAIMVCVALFPLYNAHAQTLEEQIQSKNQELEQIKLEISDTQQKLEETRGQKQTLSSQVRSLDTQIKQIDLGIKSSKIAIEKYDLEIESLQGDIQVAEKEILTKEDAVMQLLREIQQRDGDGILFILIKNKALSESLFEIQALSDLYSNLTVKIAQLNQSKEHKEVVLDKTASAREQKAIESKNLESRRIISDELRDQKQEFLAETQNKEKSYESYMTDLQNRQAEILEEIFEIESKLTSQIDVNNLPDKLPGLLATPVSGKYTLTQSYGITPYSKRFYKSGFHNGIDLAAPIGTEIVAAQDGIVVAVENQDRYCWGGAYGKYVAIKHYMGLTTLYAHLSLYTVKEGETVKKGQIIGYMGNTGFATGSHLHFGVYDSATFEIKGSNSCGPKMPFGGLIDPRNYTIF